MTGTSAMEGLGRAAMFLGLFFGGYSTESVFFPGVGSLAYLDKSSLMEQCEGAAASIGLIRGRIMQAYLNDMPSSYPIARQVADDLARRARTNPEVQTQLACLVLDNTLPEMPRSALLGQISSHFSGDLPASQIGEILTAIEAVVEDRSLNPHLRSGALRVLLEIDRNRSYRVKQIWTDMTEQFSFRLLAAASCLVVSDPVCTEATRFLLQVAQDSNQRVDYRTEAVDLLVSIEDSSILDEVLEAALNGPTELLPSVTRYLLARRTTEATSAIHKLLGDPERSSIVLGHMRGVFDSEAARIASNQVVGGGSSTKRAVAARYLLSIDSSKYEKELLAFLLRLDNHQETQREVAESLRKSRSLAIAEKAEQWHPRSNDVNP